MTTTATAPFTLQDALDQADPNQIADALRLVKLGQMVVPTKKTVSQSAALTVPLAPPALTIVSVRVTAGAAAAGVRTVSDASATPSASVVALSNDGATLTFEGNVTGAVVVYVPRSNADVTETFAEGAP